MKTALNVMDCLQQNVMKACQPSLLLMQTKVNANGRSKQGRKMVSFSDLDAGKDRTEAARLFFELLVLQAKKQVGLQAGFAGQLTLSFHDEVWASPFSARLTLLAKIIPEPALTCRCNSLKMSHMQQSRLLWQTHDRRSKMPCEIAPPVCNVTTLRLVFS